jgi:hypothetical protein
MALDPRRLEFEASELERELLAIGFKHVGCLQAGKLYIVAEINRYFVGVYVMVHDGRAFNIGESKSVRDRLKSYERWLRTTYDKDLERHGRERRAQERWKALGGMEQLEIYARPSDTLDLFGVVVPLNKPEEGALIERFRPICNWRGPNAYRLRSGDRAQPDQPTGDYRDAQAQDQRDSQDVHAVKRR